MQDFFLLIFSCSCVSIAYLDDLGFTPSAVANSPEFPVYVNNKLCKDVDGIPGACTKRIKSNENITIKIDPLQYGYTFQLQCSKETGIDISQDVGSDKNFSYVINYPSFSSLRMFTCIGAIYPTDRSFPVSSKFEIRFVVVNRDYVSREEMRLYDYKGKSYLVLGSHAHYATVWDEINGKKIKSTFRNKSVCRVYNPDKVIAFSESMQARFNFYGI